MEPNQPQQQRPQSLSNEQFVAIYQQLPVYFPPMTQTAPPPRMNAFPSMVSQPGYIPTPWYGPQDFSMWQFPHMWQRRSPIDVVNAGPGAVSGQGKPEEMPGAPHSHDVASKPYFTPQVGHSAHRNIKEVRSARRLAIGLKVRSAPTEAECSRCREGGALLNCEKCSKSFHLLCAHMTEDDVPMGPWVCHICGQLGDQRYKPEIDKLLREQKQVKDNEVKEVLNRLMSIQKDKVLRYIAQRYPSSIKAGRITYPIEDSLLFEDPALHQLIIPPPRPIPQPTHIPPHILGDLLYIVDFCHTFAELLRLTPLSVDVLDAGLLATEETPGLKALLLGLVKCLIQGLMEKEDLEELLEGSGESIKLIAEMKDSTDVLSLLPLYYMKIIYECLKIPTWRDLLDEGSSLDRLFEYGENALEQGFYSSFEYEEKLALLVFLTSCLLSTKLFHEEINTRLEKKAKLQKQKHDLNQDKKTLETKMRADSKNLVAPKQTNGSEQLATLGQQIADLQKKIATIVLRTEPLGLDRDFNEYYFFTFDRSKVYIKSMVPLDDSAKGAESGYWYVYQTKDEIQQLRQSLCQKGIRESALLESLNSIMHKVNPKVEESKNEQEYVNLMDKYPNLAGDCFILIRNLLLKTEKNFSKHLTKSKKQWDSAEARSDWEKAVERSQTPVELREQLTQFAARASTPYRTTPDKKRTDKIEVKAARPGPVKFRKVGIRLWTDLQNLHHLWMAQAKEAVSCSAVALMTIIYCEIINNYCKKTHLSSDDEADKPSKRRRTESDTERSSSSDPQEIDHEDECYICSDGGSLVCCETCPRVVHPKCIGLTVRTRQGVPKGDWFCEDCQVKQAIDKSKRSP